MVEKQIQVYPKAGSADSSISVLGCLAEGASSDAGHAANGGSTTAPPAFILFTADLRLGTLFKLFKM